MKQYEMPYSFLFTDEELTDLWSYYRSIHQIIRCVEERYHIAITDMEVHSGAHFSPRLNAASRCKATPLCRYWSNRLQ